MLNYKHLQYGAAAIALGCALGLTANAGAQVIETESMTVNVIMESSFDLTELNALHFGMLSVSTLTGGVDPEITVTPAGAQTIGTSDANNFFFVVNNTLLQQGNYTIANGAPSEQITVSVPFGTVVDPVLGSDTLTFTDIAILETDPGANANNADPSANATPTITLTTDTSGAAEFSIGATIEADGTDTYADGTYVGSMIVNANY